MSDIAFEDNKVTDVKEEFKEQEIKDKEKSSGGWVRTRYCACPDDAPTDCRFHSQSEKGWEKCPHESADRVGRWLWVKEKLTANDDDPTESQDRAMEERLSNELIKSVK